MRQGSERSLTFPFTQTVKSKYDGETYQKIREASQNYFCWYARVHSHPHDLHGSKLAVFDFFYGHDFQAGVAVLVEGPFP